MNKAALLEKFSSYNRVAVRLTLFLIALVVLTLLYPNYHSFPYEYQKGRPWVYPDLVSPIDYALLKPDGKVDEDEAAIRKSSPLIFQEVEINLNSSKIDSALDYALRDSSTVQDSVYLSWLNGWKEKTYPLLIKGWPEGVPVEELIELVGESGSISIFSKELSALTSWPQGFEIFGTEEELDLLLKKEEELIQLFPHNVEFNATLTSQILDDRLSRLTPFEGKVEQGEIIAFEGLIVDEQIVRKLDALKEAYAVSDEIGNRRRELGGVFLLTVTLLLMLYLFLKRFRTFVLEDFARLSFVLFCWILMAALARIALSFGNDYLLLAPFAVLPIVLRAFFDARLALFVHVLMIMSIGLLSSEGLEIVMLHFIAGFYAIITVDLLYKRAQLFVTLTKVVGIYFVVYMAFLLFQDTSWSEIPWRDFVMLGLNGVLALSAFPVIYFSEKVFGLVSDVSLLELTDTNNSLLREMAEKAPGTFQHSLQVANLAEAAALRIGGNPLLTRAGALYHDIGKMVNPMYFIENQTTGINPHDELGFDESAEIIIGHVKQGITKARSANLPETLIDFIRTHHGTSTVQYFYKQHIKNFPESEVDLKAFSYPGPKPFNKETAVLMMADSVEAASRSVRSKNRKELDDLVEKIINSQMTEHQFEEADITLKEISQAKEVFKSKLKDIYHFRVAYPD